MKKINYGYFRHRFDAHTDIKIMRLKEVGGIESVGCYFILLEIYGKHFSDDSDKKIEQIISARHIANAFGLRLDSTRTKIELIAECELIESLWLQSDSSSVKVAIPNFLKYYGSYKKTGIEKVPNKIKENKIKENKIKEEEYNNSRFEVIDDFSHLDDIIKKYIATSSEKQQRKLIDSYGIDTAIEYAIKFASWMQDGKGKGMSRTFYLSVLKWIKKDGIKSKEEIQKEEADFKKQQEEAIKKLDSLWN